MSIIFAGGEPHEFEMVTGDMTTDDRTSFIDPEYSRVALTTLSNTRTFKRSFTHSNEVYAVSYVRMSSTTNTNNAPLLTLGFVRLAGTGTAGELKAQRFDGTDWVDFGDPISFSVAPTRWCIGTKKDAAGFAKVYKDGVEVASWTGDTSARDDTTELLFEGAGQLRFWSEIVIASHNLKDARLKTLVPNSEGANTAWTGSLGDINVMDHSNDTFISSDTAGQKSTFGTLNLPSDSLEVSAVVVSGVFRRSDTGPQNIDALVRTGGLDYSKPVGTLSEDFETKTGMIWEANPATSIGWTKAQVDAIEIGVESGA